MKEISKILSGVGVDPAKVYDSVVQENIKDKKNINCDLDDVFCRFLSDSYIGKNKKQYFNNDKNKNLNEWINKIYEFNNIKIMNAKSTSRSGEINLNQVNKLCAEDRGLDDDCDSISTTTVDSASVDCVVYE